MAGRGPKSNRATGSNEVQPSPPGSGLFGRGPRGAEIRADCPAASWLRGRRWRLVLTSKPVRIGDVRLRLTRRMPPRRKVQPSLPGMRTEAPGREPRPQDGRAAWICFEKKKRNKYVSQGIREAISVRWRRGRRLHCLQVWRGPTNFESAVRRRIWAGRPRRSWYWGRRLAGACLEIVP